MSGTEIVYFVTFLQELILAEKQAKYQGKNYRPKVKETLK